MPPRGYRVYLFQFELAFKKFSHLKSYLHLYFCVSFAVFASFSLE